MVVYFVWWTSGEGSRFELRVGHWVELLSKILNSCKVSHHLEGGISLLSIGWDNSPFT